MWESEPEFAGWIKPSTKGNTFFYCTACVSNLKCGGGKFTISKHANSLKHINSVKGLFVSVLCHQVHWVTEITFLFLWFKTVLFG